MANGLHDKNIIGAAGRSSWRIIERQIIMKRGNPERIIFARLNYPETRLVKNSVEFLGIGCLKRVIPTELLTLKNL